MTYTHITYPTGEEFLFDHGAIDDAQVCHGDLLAMNIRGRWEHAGNTPVIVHTGNEIDGGGVRTTDEVLGQTLESLPQASRVPEFYGFDYTVGQLPEKVKFSQIDRGITEDEDMTVSALIFSSKSLQGSNGHVSGTVVGVQNSLGWQIIDPSASGAYRALNVLCELEPGYGEDLYDVVENLNNCTIVTSDLQSVSGQDLQM